MTDAIHGKAPVLRNFNAPSHVDVNDRLGRRHIPVRTWMLLAHVNVNGRHRSEKVVPELQGLE